MKLTESNIFYHLCRKTTDLFEIRATKNDSKMNKTRSCKRIIREFPVKQSNQKSHLQWAILFSKTNTLCKILFEYIFKPLQLTHFLKLHLEKLNIVFALGKGCSQCYVYKLTTLHKDP